MHVATLEKWSVVQLATRVAPAKGRKAQTEYYTEWVSSACAIAGFEFEEGWRGVVESLTATGGLEVLSRQGADGCDRELSCQIHKDGCTVVLTCNPPAETQLDEVWERCSLRGMCSAETASFHSAVFQADLAATATQSRGYGEAHFRDDCEWLRKRLDLGPGRNTYAQLRHGWLGSLGGGVYLLGSYPGFQGDTDALVMDSLPTVHLNRGRLDVQKAELDSLLSVLNRDENAPRRLAVQPETEREEWVAALGVIPDLDTALSTILRHMRLHKGQIGVAGARESCDLHEMMGDLSLRFARFSRELSRMAVMSRNTEIYAENLRGAVDEIQVKRDYGLAAGLKRDAGVVRLAVDDTVFMLTQLLERASTVLDTASSRIEALNTNREMGEARLQSAQVCLISAVTAAMGAMALFADDEALKALPIALKLDWAVVIGVACFEVGDFLFNLRRAKTLTDRLSFGLLAACIGVLVTDLVVLTPLRVGPFTLLAMGCRLGAGLVGMALGKALFEWGEALVLRHGRPLRHSAPPATTHTTPLGEEIRMPPLVAVPTAQTGSGDGNGQRSRGGAMRN